VMVVAEAAITLAEAMAAATVVAVTATAAETGAGG
jgi:hypothetical protein